MSVQLAPTKSDRLAIDVAKTAAQIESRIARHVHELRRRGAVVAVSGGVDSAVVATLCVRALGRDAVLGLFLPENDTPSDARDDVQALAAKLGLRLVVEDIAPALRAIGCYDRQLEAIRTVFPDCEEGWRFHLAVPPLGERIPIFRLTVESPDGTRRTSRMSSDAHRQLLAATAYKQRLRTVAAYYHADRLGYAVAGTANRLEHDLGFFVKQGDGAADLKPIVHLYKTQVFALAAHLGVPESIRTKPPSTDTFSLPQTQEEFYFSVPFRLMDAALDAHDAGVAEEDAARELGIGVDLATRIYRDIDAKRRTTEYLRLPPIVDGEEND